jgi:hypothetical protein
LERALQPLLEHESAQYHRGCGGNRGAETAGGVLVALVVAKGLAYAISLAVGFRGGPIFQRSRSA